MPNSVLAPQQRLSTSNHYTRGQLRNPMPLMQFDSYQTGIKSRELVKRSNINPVIRQMQ